jgi:hypothetical protein
MNSAFRDCIVGGEAVGLSAGLSLRRARRLALIGRPGGMDIRRPHDAIVAGGAKRPGEAT